MIRPQPATWFEIIAARDDTRAAIESLAAAGCAEIESRDAGTGSTADIARACLLFQSAEGDGIFSRITGWTSDPRKLAACLQRSEARALVHFPRMPEHLQAPLLLRNPEWVQPFEVFSRLAGMPGRYSTDPSGLLMFVAPLLFGYMFGDVVQGLVLVVAGLVLQRRWPMTRLLVAGGLAAILFGFVFGSAASIHGAVPALWLDPLDEPLPVLLAPLAFGAALLAVGLLFNGVEAYWRGGLAAWLTGDAGFLVLYVGAMLAFVHPAGQVLALAGTALFVLGRVRRDRRAGAALGAIGELIEKSAQILINTVSFVRVGAFAMAHAGLSSALAAMADAAGSCVPYVLVLLFGNIVIVAIEVMVASIQTTRLILFEFFTRFFASTGREFHPLPSTSPSPEEKKNEPNS